MEAGSSAYDPARLATLRGYDRRRLRNVISTLAVTEFRLRYYGNALGFFWTLAKPLLLFGVLYLAFTEVIKFGNGDIAHYPVYLLTGIVLFNYFSETTGRAVASLVERESLLRKVPMPPAVIPVSVSLTAVLNLLLELVAVFVFVLASGIDPRVAWLETIPLIAVLVLFATAVASLLATLFVPFRDTRAIWEVALQLLFWATPIVYTIDFVPESLRHWVMLNPLAAIVTQLRHAVIDPSAPTAAGAIGHPVLLLVPAAIVVGVVWLSVSLDRRLAPRLAERL